MSTFAFLLLAVMLAFLAGGMAGTWAYAAWRHVKARRSPLTLDGLAKRVEVSGDALVGVARGMREWALVEPSALHRRQLREWAAVCERATVHHLECLNAVTLDSLRTIETGPVHLGDFVPGIERRRNPPAKPVPEILLRRSR